MIRNEETWDLLTHRLHDDSLLSFLINSLKVANAHADIPMLHSNTGWSLPPAQGAL